MSAEWTAHGSKETAGSQSAGDTGAAGPSGDRGLTECRGHGGRRALRSLRPDAWGLFPGTAEKPETAAAYPVNTEKADLATSTAAARNYSQWWAGLFVNVI